MSIHTRKISRRNFIKVSALAGGGMLLELEFPLAMAAEDPEEPGGATTLDAYVEIAADGRITIYSANPEMGQGVKTALPMIVAEEMDARWSDVNVLQSPVDPKRFGYQGAGGSTTVWRSFDLMREMGATARHMLIDAAAQIMKAPRGELIARNSQVIHPADGQKLPFGRLAALAARQPPPDPNTLAFKNPEDYTIIGTSVGGVDNLAIVTGRTQFGIDTRVPNMAYACYYKCPDIGARIIGFNDLEIRRLPGITDAFIIQGNGDVTELSSGVALVGASTWAVFNAQQKLKVDWDTSGASTDDWDNMVAAGRRLAEDRGADVRVTGDVDKAFEQPSNKSIESFYSYPFLSHACLEPMNATAWYRSSKDGRQDSLEVWAPVQAPLRIAPACEKLFGMDPGRVTVHLTRLGGGFGRRSSVEFVCEAAAISRHVDGPVKLTWMREDDMHHDFYRVGGFQKLKGAVDQQGRLVAWQQHFIGMAHDGRAVSGSRFAVTEFPMLNIANVRGSRSMMEIDTPCGPWRAPGDNTMAFVVQSFIHELATLAGRDHLEFLLEIMGKPRWFEPGNIHSLNTGRAAAVIKLAAEQAGWGKSLPKGRGIGLAFHFSHAAHVAEVAELSVDTGKRIRLHRVTAAVDIGPIVNMSGAIAQVQGAIIDGFSAMAGQKITMKDGRIQQSNFNDYPLLRIPAAPDAIDVHFIQSKYIPTGLGEPALPPLAPAVSNAIYAATGQRVRRMPLTDEGFSV